MLYQGVHLDYTVGDTGYTRGLGGANPPGALTYDFAKFSQMKLKEFGPGGGGRVQNYVDPLLL